MLQEIPKLKIQLTEKQLELWNYILDKDTIVILFGGTASSSKSYGMCLCSLLLCLTTPGVIIGIFRKTASDLNRSTKQTFLEILAKNNIIRDVHYKLKDMGSVFEFTNGSKVMFMNLDPAGDPTFAKIGSLNIDYGFIDEAGEIAFTAYSALLSRVGRGNYCVTNKKPGKLIMSCNPSSNFLRKEFYDKYIKQDGGESRRWQTGYTYFENQKIPAYHCFIRATVYDNPFIPNTYIEQLKSLPRLQRLRLYEGNWDFMDNDNSICSMEDISKITVEKLPEKQYEEDNHTLYGEVDKKEIFSKYGGIDVSSSGNDNTTLSIIDQNTLIGCYILKINKNAKSTAIEYWKEARKILERYGFNRENARNIFLEKNGVGEGMLSQAISDGWNINGVTQTSKTRSENYYHLGLDIQQGNFMIYSKIDNYDELCQELVVHTVEFNNQEPKICPKEKVKEYIGHSPDLSDSLAWAYAASKSIKPNVVKSRFRIATI